MLARHDGTGRNAHTTATVWVLWASVANLTLNHTSLGTLYHATLVMATDHYRRRGQTVEAQGHIWLLALV